LVVEDAMMDGITALITVRAVAKASVCPGCEPVPNESTADIAGVWRTCQ
jgi:hypothetical protein